MKREEPEKLIKGFIEYLLQEDTLKRLMEDYFSQFDFEMEAKECTKIQGLRLCEHCKETYRPKRSDQKYCGKSCNNKADSKRNPRRNHVKIKDGSGESKTIFQRRNESIEQFEKRVGKISRSLNTV